MADYGGPTPLLKWETINVEPPAGTSATQPVEAFDIFQLKGATDDDGSGYKCELATAGSIAAQKLGIALYGHTDERVQMAFHFLAPGSAQVRRLRYTGTPTVGHGIAISASNRRRVVDSGSAAGAGPMITKVVDSTWVEVTF